jgi:FkbM family methyltransferase
MILLRKIVRRTLLEISKLFIHSNVKRLLHLKVQGCNLVVIRGEDVGRQLELFGSYEEDEVNFLQSHLNESSICFDIGGNIGFFSMLFAKRAYRGQVHVFEPIPLNAAIIRTNCILNGFKNIQLNECAVGSNDDFITFSVSKDSAFSSIKNTKRREESELIRVAIISLDSYIKNNNIPSIDIMKVDVEGAEEMVLDGAESLFSNEKTRPKMILMELFEENLNIFESSTLSILSKMDDYGYQPFVIQSGGRGLVAYNQSVHKHFYNVIFKSKLKEKYEPD